MNTDSGQMTERPGEGPRATPPALTGKFPVEKIRKDFPILAEQVHGRPLVYLDNAATTQKPFVVLEAVDRYYRQANANVHRGVHTLSDRATEAYENARESVRRFINARETNEIVFVRGATEGINLVAQSYGRGHVRAGDEILLTVLEHHANIVPWQLLCEEVGARLRVVPISTNGELDLEIFAESINSRTRLVAVTHVSNAIGTVNPIKRLVEIAHAHGVPVLADGAQAAPHMAVDVAALDCDFYVFSGHKLYGPTGIGVLYGKARLLEQMPPFQGGGEMIEQVRFERTTYAPPPQKFEAGTPHIAGAVGLAAAIEYIEQLGISRISAHEQAMTDYALRILTEIPGLQIIGTPSHRAGIISFALEGIHPHDIGTILDHHGVAIRTGHHCAMPLMDHLGVTATARASFGLYNTESDVDALACAIRQAKEVFR